MKRNSHYGFFAMFVLQWLLVLWLPMYAAAEPAVVLHDRSSAAAPAPPTHPNHFSKGLLWQVSGSGVEPSHLFGTIHSEDERVLSMLNHVEPALLSARRVVLETDLNEETTAAFIGAMMFSDGRTLKDVLDAALLKDTLKVAAQRGVPAEQAVMFKPWALMTLLSMPEPKTGVFMDRVLYQKAQDHQISLAGLESSAEQIAVLDGLALADQIALLAETVANYAALAPMLEALIGAYQQRDLGELERLYEQYMAESDPDLESKVSERLLVKRNHVMAERMLPYLEHGKAFIAVGALHLPGTDGLLQLLTQRGYTVTPVY